MEALTGNRGQLYADLLVAAEIRARVVVTRWIEECVQEITEAARPWTSAILKNTMDANRPAMRRLDRDVQAGNPRPAAVGGALELDLVRLRHQLAESFVV